MPRRVAAPNTRRTGGVQVFCMMETMLGRTGRRQGAICCGRRSPPVAVRPWTDSARPAALINRQDYQRRVVLKRPTGKRTYAGSQPRLKRRCTAGAVFDRQRRQPFFTEIEMLRAAVVLPGAQHLG